MAAPDPKKILRIGIIHNNRIIEERLFRKTEAITIGQSPRNTFVYPLPGFPRSYELFKKRGDDYTLAFPKGLEGKVSSLDDIFDLDELVQAGKAKTAGDLYTYDLNDQARGKIVLGELTLLFQFVTPPPPVPKLKLPAAAKGGWWRQLDVAFALILLASLVIQGGSTIALNVWWETKGQYVVSAVKKKSRLFETLKAEVQIKQAQAEVPETQVDDKADDDAPPVPAPVVKEEPKKKEKSGKQKGDDEAGRQAGMQKGDAGKDKEARYKKQVENVKKNTLIKFLVSEGEGDGDGMYQNTLADGVTAGKMGDAWNMKGGIQVAQEGDVGQFIGKPKGGGAGGGGYANASDKYKVKKGGIAVGKVETPEKKAEVKIKLKIGGELGDKLGTGDIDKGSVSAVFKRRQGAIRHCYEKRLKVNQDLSGKLRVMFTIGPAGRITNIVVQSNSTNDNQLAGCITSRIKEWPFPRPKGGAVTFVHTIVLTKG